MKGHAEKGLGHPSLLATVTIKAIPECQGGSDIMAPSRHLQQLLQPGRLARKATIMSRFQEHLHDDDNSNNEEGADDANRTTPPSPPPPPVVAAAPSTAIPGNTTTTSFFTNDSYACHFVAQTCAECERSGRSRLGVPRLRTRCIAPLGFVHPGTYLPNTCGTCHGPFNVRYRPSESVDACERCARARDGGRFLRRKWAKAKALFAIFQ